MKTDLSFCMSSYLQYRTVTDKSKRFSDSISPWYYGETKDRTPVNCADELEKVLKEQIEKTLNDSPSALMLSSGMDSAILARFLPENTMCYTLHCKSKSGLDETENARKFAQVNNLNHKIIEITWEDYEKYSLPLMERKGYPIHSIEVQIYKAALEAKKDGIETLIFGETADIIYGGHSKLLSRDWTLDEFTERFSFVDPRKVLKNPQIINDPILPFVKEDGFVDVHAFLNEFEYPVSLGFYTNACNLGGVKLSAPYSHTKLSHKLDLEKIRNGDGKYIVRSLYKKLYPDFPVPDKTPLPRPMGEWLCDWNGTENPLFDFEHISSLSGDGKWYVYALEKFVSHIAEG